MNEDNLDYSRSEWQSFTKQEKRIILMLRVHNMDIDQIRASLTWPLEPMSKRTFSNHKSKLMAKMAKIRLDRSVKVPLPPESIGI